MKLLVCSYNCIFFIFCSSLFSLSKSTRAMIQCQSEQYICFSISDMLNIIHNIKFQNSYKLMFVAVTYSSVCKAEIAETMYLSSWPVLTMSVFKFLIVWFYLCFEFILMHVIFILLSIRDNYSYIEAVLCYKWLITN